MRTHARLVLLLLLAGCASAPADPPRSWLDERTAVSVTAQGTPIVFAREEHLRAINVRDYAEIGAVEINRMGDRRLYLALQSWSTIDRTAAERERMDRSLSRVTVYADDRPIELTQAAASAEQLGLSRRPFVAPTPGTREIYFTIARSDLRSIALARVLQLRGLGAEEPDIYLQWQDARPSLAAFLAQLPAPR